MDTGALTISYARVKAILDDAAGASTADYGGAGRFWDNGAEALETADVYGVKMIAEAPAHACCAVDGERSKASGLIKGLRGEAPFDGGRFPRLPWGGSAVTPFDIDCIADWIDAGCPGETTSVAVPLSPGDAAAPATVRVSEIAEFAVAEDGYLPGAGEPRRRMSIDCMGEPQRERLRRGFRKLYDLNKWPEDRRSYNNQALVHQNHCQHGWERFLPWHRAYLYEFEQNLQDFEPGLMMPYWDFTLPEYKPDDPTDGRIIPEALKAYLTEEAADRLVLALHDPEPTTDQKKAIRALARDRTYFTTQHDFFCHLITKIGYTAVTPDPKNANRRLFIDALLESNSLWYPLRYSGEYAGGGTINSVIHYHYPSADDIAQIMSLNNFRDFGGGSIYDSAFGFLDQNPHNTMHIWTGGMNPDAGQSKYVCTADAAAAAAAAPHAAPAALQALANRRNAVVQVGGRHFHAREDLYSQPGLGDMFSNLTASFDPVFWPIHVNIDRIWWEWQKLNPNALPADLDSVLSPWNYTIRDTLDIAPFGYEYVRSAHFMPVGLEAPVNRFVSQPITVPDAARSFKRAEIRLHQVPQLMRSCFVRAFLNDPAANASTPIKGNPHYAGYISIFGHGACYGGPGHCDVPPAQARPFDQRGRSHNAPRNHRIDVTAAAKRALEGGGPLRITLVVIGGDYQEEKELLKLEGVSISFLD